MIRAFAYGVMGRRIDPSRWTHLSYFLFQPVLRNWCNKSCGMVHIKDPLLLAHVVTAGFLSCYLILNGPLPYVLYHVPIKIKCVECVVK